MVPTIAIVETSEMGVIEGVQLLRGILGVYTIARTAL